MSSKNHHQSGAAWPVLAHFPLPAKVLVTMVIMTLALAMSGALAQVIVHDIIPTFQQMRAGIDSDAGAEQPAGGAPATSEPGESRGDLFGEEIAAGGHSERKVFYESEQFIWTLKWTHIHLFGINMIFIFTGGLTVFLALSLRTRAWLVGLPFLGILLDIAAMWLKAFVSPVFFWLHIPGGGLFGMVFTYVCLRGLWEMWGMRPKTG